MQHDAHLAHLEGAPQAGRRITAQARRSRQLTKHQSKQLVLLGHPTHIASWHAQHDTHLRSAVSDDSNKNGRVAMPLLCECSPHLHEYAGHCLHHVCGMRAAVVGVAGVVALDGAHKVAQFVLQACSSRASGMRKPAGLLWIQMLQKHSIHACTGACTLAVKGRSLLRHNSRGI